MRNSGENIDNFNALRYMFLLICNCILAACKVKDLFKVDSQILGLHFKF